MTPARTSRGHPRSPPGQPSPAPSSLCSPGAPPPKAEGAPGREQPRALTTVLQGDGSLAGSANVNQNGTVRALRLPWINTPCPQIYTLQIKSNTDAANKEWGKYLLFRRSVVSSPLRPHGLQHTGLPCPSQSPRACSNSCPLSR